MTLRQKLKLAFRIKKYDHGDSTTWSMDRSTLKPLAFFVRVGWTKEKREWWAVYPEKEKFFHTHTWRWTQRGMKHRQIFIGRLAVEHSFRLGWKA